MISLAAEKVQEADILIIIGTSLAVYPAAGLIRYTRPNIPIYLIDPKPVTAYGNITYIAKGASAGMEEVFERLKN